MNPNPASSILGIEGGGTKTTWALLSPGGKIVKRGEAGPGNTLLLSDVALGKLLTTIRRDAGTSIAAIGGAFAGCSQPAEKSRVEKIVRRTWPRAGVVRVMEDTRSVLAAAFGDGPGIAVIAGTGSNVAGQKSATAPIEKAGGWGHLFADRGSAYDLARRGMELAFARYDADKKISRLGREFLAATGQASMEELVPYLLRDTGKNTVAGWAKCVLAAAKKGDREAKKLLDDAALALAEKTAMVARRLKLRAPRVALIGGLFENRPIYFAAYQRALRRILPRARAFLLDVPGTIGAARVAGLKSAGAPITSEKNPLAPIAEPHRLAAFARASTEQRNPRSRGLDRRSIPRLVDLFIREEREVEKALRAERKNIAKAAALVARKLATGGRLFYVGAGHERPSWRGRCERDAADLQRRPGGNPGHHRGRSGGGVQEPGRRGGQS